MRSHRRSLGVLIRAIWSRGATALPRATALLARRLAMTPPALRPHPRFSETLPGLLRRALRGSEDAKIDCGRRHVEALRVGEAPAAYLVARTVDNVMTRTLAAG